MDSSAKSTIGIKLVSDQDQDQHRLVAALGYVFTPLVPIVVLTSDMRRVRFLRRHAVQALIWSGPFLLALAAVIVALVLTIQADFLAICLLPFALLVPFLPGMIWARRIYLGGDVVIPIIGQFVARR